MKYRGSEGWIMGDGERPRRYKDKDVVGRHGEKPPAPKEPLRCPYCNSIDWRQDTGHCATCDWSIDDLESGPRHSKDDDSVLVCCSLLLGAPAVVLVLMGMGYGAMGGGGLILGAGAGVLLVLAVGWYFLGGLVADKKKEGKE